MILGLNLRGIIEDTTYYWQARTIDTGLRKSGWSNQQSEYIPNIPPTVPVLVSPLNDFTTNQVNISFDWEDSTDTVSGVELYEFRVSTNGVFSNIYYASNTAVSNYAINGMDENIYYWRVQAKDFAGNYSGWASSRTFTVSLPPGKVTGFAAATGLQVKLNWTAPGADEYTGDVTGGMWQINYSSTVSVGTTSGPDFA
ncbi:hypothetical protein ACFLR5_02070, partial [Elusimicrobiota bacterium]